MSTFVDTGRKSCFKTYNGCSVTLPILPRFITFCCVSITKRLAGKTNKLLQGLIRGGASRAPGAAARCRPALPSRCPCFFALYSMCPQHRHVCDAPLCGSMSKHFTCPLVACGLRAHFTFCLAGKTFHFCAAVYVRLPLTYICAKISRPAPPNIACAYFGCSAAQVIFPSNRLKVCRALLTAMSTCGKISDKR